MDTNPKLKRLKEKKDQIDARIKNLEAREKSREKKLDTRRKILLGALLTEWMGQDKLIQKNAHDKLETFLVRKIDRELFGFEPRAEKKEEAQKPKPVDAKPKPETTKAQKTA